MRTIDSEMQRQREEAQRNQQRLAQWWERYCEARPLAWALGADVPSAAHPFRRKAA